MSDAQAGNVDEGSFYDNVQHASQTLHNHSASANDLRNALRILFLCFNGLQSELADVRDLLAETQVELAGARAEKRTRRRKKIAGEAEEDEADTADLVSSLAKFYVLFVTPYTGNHLFEGVTSESVGWTRDDIDTRFDKQFPNNRRIGEALDLLHYAIDPLKPLVIGMDPEFVTLFRASAEAKRSEAARRGRESGREIFEMLRDRVDEEFKRLQANKITLSFKRGKASSESVSVLKEFCKDLFAPAASTCRKKLNTLMDFIGVSETTPGVYSSDAFCNLIYRDSKRVAGNEFLAEVLFRFARAVIYGPSFIDRPEDVVMNTNNPISGFTLQVTPGFIALICILARIVLSPDGSFTRDGKGPVTSIMWIDDFELYLYVLTSIWDEEGGKVIASEWNKNVFPRFTQQDRTPMATVVTPTPAAPSQVRETAEDIIARNRAACSQREQDDEEVAFTFPTGHDVNNDSLHITLDNTVQEEYSDGLHDSDHGLFVQRSQSQSARPNTTNGNSLFFEPTITFEPEQSNTDSQMLRTDPGADSGILTGNCQPRTSTPARGARLSPHPSTLPSLSDSSSQHVNSSTTSLTATNQANTPDPSIPQQLEHPIVTRRTTRSTRNPDQATQGRFNGVEAELVAGVAQLSVGAGSAEGATALKKKSTRNRGGGGIAGGSKTRKAKGV